MQLLVTDHATNHATNSSPGVTYDVAQPAAERVAEHVAPPPEKAPGLHASQPPPVDSAANTSLPARRALQRGPSLSSHLLQASERMQQHAVAAAVVRALVALLVARRRRLPGRRGGATKALRWAWGARLLARLPTRLARWLWRGVRGRKRAGSQADDEAVVPAPAAAT